MAIILDQKDRNVIPRWRDFITTTAIGELKSTNSNKPEIEFPNDDFLSAKLRAWKLNKSVAFAADLVGTAYVLGKHDEAKEAAKFLLERKSEIPSSLLTIAKNIIDPESKKRFDFNEEIENFTPEQLYKRISNFRQQLREEPRNSIVYVDLARAYTLLDETQKAEQAMNIALRLNPNNRFILRSASRFFIHLGETEHRRKAHQILRRAEATKTDPWLLAAEIAIASSVNIPSRFAKIGQKVLSDKNYSPSETSELATALGMKEIENGKTRNARNLFLQSLIAPTENSVAQIEWASNKLLNIDLDIKNFEKIPLIHEAKALEYYASENWEGALAESWKWFYDQPFSDRPVILASYIANTVLGDHKQSIEILKRGRIANPKEITLINNLAFSYASSGQVNEAKKVFDEINISKLTGDEKVIVTATEGLIAYRSGNAEKGRAKYLEAIRFAENSRRKDLKARAYIYYAREEMLAKSIFAETIRQKALEESENIDEAIAKILAKRILKPQKK